MFIVFLSIITILCIVYPHRLYSSLKKAEMFTKSSNNKAPGPIPLPIVGNLALLRHYKFPFVGFTELAKQFGDIYSLTLGNTRCVIVNNLDLIREVLNQNGKFFGGRPNFLRYNKLFGGDRNNSLALCDWSRLQQRRRNLARRHCSPRSSTQYFTKLSNIGCMETSVLMDTLKDKIVPGKTFNVKPVIQGACANMFCQYMCSVRFNYEDPEFREVVKYFDEIFWEINQGYAVDFLPWLAPFYKKHIKKLIKWSSSIRNFILSRIINAREQSLDLDEPEKDFTDVLLKSLTDDKNVTRDTIIYMLEDFIGGHSAVGNLVMLALSYVAKHPHMGTRIQQEADRITYDCKCKISLYDMDKMPYTVATIFEVLRYSSSPIVPHVATENTVISKYAVTVGTVVFINNYILNTSDQYWCDPELFDPERFLEKKSITKQRNTTEKFSFKRRYSESSDSGVEFEKDVHINTVTSLGNSNHSNNCSIDKSREQKFQVKRNIPHFFPFSLGKRTCIGQNLVKGFGFILLANILQHYNVKAYDLASMQINPACVALPTVTFPLLFTERLSNTR